MSHAQPQPSLLTFYLSLIYSMITLTFGRLFPRLTVPPKTLNQKTAIITGGNSGIGQQIALELAKRGATVYIACRNISKANDSVAETTRQVPRDSGGQVKPLTLDTSSLSSVRKFAREWGAQNNGKGLPIDFLYHNAGTGSTTPGQEFTEEGYPVIYATNFLGSFLLTQLLESYLSPTARVIFTTSTGQYSGDFSSRFSLGSIKNNLEAGFHHPGQSKPTAPNTQDSSTKIVKDSAMYANTKTMQVAFASLLNEHFARTAPTTIPSVPNPPRKTAHAFSPGFTMTPIFDKVLLTHFRADPLWGVLKASAALVATDVSQGAATGVWLAVTEDTKITGQGGGYWDRMSRRVSKVDVMEREKVERLWLRWEADCGAEWR